MKLNPNEFAKAFKEIKKTSLTHSTCKLVVYVSCLNVDALCGAKIFCNLLKKQLIPFQLIPIVGYADLTAHYAKLDDDISNVLLLGCGATVDVESLLKVDASELMDENNVPSRKIYVVDGHRPWNLDNVFGSHIVHCFDDGTVDGELEDEKSAYERLLEISNEDEDENEDTDKKSHIRINDDDDDEAGDGEEEEDEAAKRQRLIEEDMQRCEEVLEKYYMQGSTVVTSIGVQIYTMVQLLGAQDSGLDTLWLAILGTTVLDATYPQVYKRLYPLLRDEVLRIGNTSSGSKNTESTNVNMDYDYNLFLLRHWSLYNSFLYSTHVNAKLLLWHEEGRKKLNKMFAKMGISLQVANQNWLYMDIEIKKNLPTIFGKYLGLYGLEEVIREGFTMSFGYKGSISASEYTESLVALLQNQQDLVNTENIEITEMSSEEATKKREQRWVTNFWSAWDALSTEQVLNKNLSNKKMLGIDLALKGLELAKSQQQTIFKTGAMVMEKKMIKNLRVFRLVVLKDEVSMELEFFSNPLNLQRLGHWLLEGLAELENQPLLPMVLASLDANRDKYLVAGLAPLYPRTNTQHNNSRKKRKKQNGTAENNFELNKTLLNTFSVAFQQVSQSTGAEVKIDSFESSVIEVRKEDLAPFLEKLTLCGLV